eukprot:Platyproteum_vivax@DN669_c0_g1_i1.p1
MSSNPVMDLSWLPSDAEEQLSLGFRIISNAYKNRVHSLEAECRNLKQQMEEKHAQYTAIHKKNSLLEVELIESHQRANQLAEENKNLIFSSKKLHRDIHRLESLKQAVLSSIQGDMPDEDTKAYSSIDHLHQSAPLTMQEITGDVPASDPFMKFTQSPDLTTTAVPEV